MLYVLIPAAGESQRFKNAGHTAPKGLLRLKWKDVEATMIEHVIGKLANDNRVLVGCKAEDSVQFLRLPNHYSIVNIDKTIGQADTVRKLAACVPSILDDLLVINSDNGFSPPDLLECFVQQCRDASVKVGALTFKATDIRYGYVDDSPFFTIGAEKLSISNNALAGAFYFKDAGIVQSAYDKFIHAVSLQYLKYPKENSSEAYLSSLFAHIDGKKLSVTIPRSCLHEWGTPASLRADTTIQEIYMGESSH